MTLEKQDFIAALQSYSEEPSILPDELWSIYQSAVTHSVIREKAAYPLSALMAQPAITISAEAFLMEASRLMLEKRISGLPVVENKMLVGIITEGDLMAGFGVPVRAAQTSRMKKALDSWLHPHPISTSPTSTVGEVMIRSVVSAEPQQTLKEGLELMRRYQVTRLVIVDDQRQVVGIVTRSDILRFTSADPQTTLLPPPATAS